MEGNASPVEAFLRNSVTLQPSLHCSLTVYEALLFGEQLDCPPFKPLSLSKAGTCPQSLWSMTTATF